MATLYPRVVIMIGRSRSTEPCDGGVDDRMAADAQLVDVFDHDHAHLHGNAEQREESDAGRHAEIGVR